MKIFGSSEAFLVGDEIEWEVVDEGVKRKITGYDDTIMMVQVAFENGAVGSMHKHYHAQVSYVMKGQFEVKIGDGLKIMKEGDSFYVAPHVWHGVVCLEEGILIDVFSPIREDFVQK